VPPSARSKAPSTRLRAPVKAPFSCPKRADSTRFSGIAAQLSWMKGRSRRGLCSWSARAASSLPVPDSPCRRTVARVGGGGRDHVQHLPDLRRIADDLSLVAKCHHLAAERLVLPAEARELERRADGHLELVGPHRLGDVVHRAGLDGRDRVLDGAVPGEHDDRDVAPFLPEVLEELEPGHAGHPVVEDDEVERLPLQHAERFRDVGRAVRRMSHPEERVVEDRADRGIVVDEQDVRHREVRGCRAQVRGERADTHSMDV
jgi:hypothetical protein